MRSHDLPESLREGADKSETKIIVFPESCSSPWKPVRGNLNVVIEGALGLDSPWVQNQGLRPGMNQWAALPLVFACENQR